MNNFPLAEELLKEFKGDSYLHGLAILPKVGQAVAGLGRKALLIEDRFPGSDKYIDQVKNSLSESRVDIIATAMGAKPNCPREDLFRITEILKESKPDVLVSFGGGSTIDAVKSAEVLRTLGGSIDDYFGTGLVSKTLQKSDKHLTGHVAIQSASSSGAHLTKYSNITDIHTGQKKLVVDNAIVPQRPIFDYSVTLTAPPSLTIDGAIDGFSHSLEVLYSTVGKPEYDRVQRVSNEGIKLIVNYLPRALKDPTDIEARYALGLATDLGGYSIMLGGTNGAHLTSFSLVDIMSHGRACGLLNPYYTVFFAPAIQQPLRNIGQIFYQAGYTTTVLDKIQGRDLALAVAEAMIAFMKKMGLPTTLDEIDGFTNLHIERALIAAKDPQLKMKLENMPVALTSEMVDEYMGPILLSAKNGNLSLIKNV